MTGKAGRPDDEAVVRTSKPDFRRVLESAPEILVVLSRDLRIETVSDLLLKVSRLTRDDLVGRHLFDALEANLSEPDRSGLASVRASLDRVLAAEASDAMAVLRYPLRRPEEEGGGYEDRFWSPSAHPIFDAEDRLSWILLRAEDVTTLVQSRDADPVRRRFESSILKNTERMEAEVLRRGQELEEANSRLRQANQELGELRRQLELEVAEKQEALRWSDERFRLLVEGVKEYAIVMLDADGRVASWSPAAERAKGYKESEIVGKNYSCFFGREDIAAGVPEQLLRDAVRDGSVVNEGWRVRADGSRYWADVVVTTLLHPDGQVRGFAKVSRDMTEQRSSEVLLQSIVDTAIDGVITIDSRGTVQTFNRAAEEIFGYEAVEVIGRNVNMLMPEPYRSEHDGYLTAYLETGVAKVIGIGREVRGTRKDGSTFPLELAVSRFEIDDKPCFTGLVRDISVRKRLEAQLQHAHRMEAVGQLAAGVAHDFNNLLTVISGYSELVAGAVANDEKVAPLVEEIGRAAERASSLTAQLLAFTRQQVLELKSFDLNAVLRRTEKMLGRLIGEHIDLRTVLADDILPVKSDAGQIDQVVMNLAVNARDAMPDGGYLTIETRNVEVDSAYADVHPGITPGDYVLLSVSDNGCGMPESVKQKIFEPFFTTKDVGQGSGLGLSVIDGIVRQTGGHIEVYSEVGVGSVFKIYLPVAQEAISTRRTEKESRDARGGELVLLVEDDPAVRGLAVRSLQDSGYAVLEASDGVKALEVLAESGGSIDLLVTDVVMPVMGGRTLVEKAHENFPGIRVLYMSGYTDDAIIRHGIVKVGYAFIQKPFTPTTFVTKVREVLDGGAPES